MHAAPCETSIVTVGDVDPNESRAAVERVFGEWAVPPPPAPPVLPASPAMSRRRVDIPMMNKAQADIAYGFVTLRRTDPDYYACWLMNRSEEHTSELQSQR